MTLDIRIGTYSLRDVIVGPPTISDSTDAVCRVLEFSVVNNIKEVGVLMGRQVELWYNEKRWFHGWIQKRAIDAAGSITITAYDGMFFMKMYNDDFYFKNMTGTQIIKAVAARVGVKVANLANTGTVFKQLWYPGAAADKIATDVLVRTYKANSRKFWLRWDPTEKGITLYERLKPKQAWAFLSGVNLVGASYEESAEEMYNVVKLVDRETGKGAVRSDKESVTQYGQRQYFEEVDKDAAKIIGKLADQKLKELSKVAVAMSIDGINPYNSMRQFFSGDIIYVEEKTTGIVGAYYIQNIKQSFETNSLVKIAADVVYTMEVPALQYDDATKKPDFLKTKAEKEAEKKAAAAKKKKPNKKKAKKEDPKKETATPKPTTTK